MARTAEGWKLDWRTGIGMVRFRLRGKRHEISTRTRDPLEAARLAPQIYSDFVSGRVTRSASGALVHPGTPVDATCAEWIADIMPEIADGTDGTYETYARHWSKHFKTMGNVSSASIGDYQRRRLGHVQRTTVIKERSALLRFLLWCQEKNMLRDVPAFPKLAKKATGTRHRQARKPPQIELTPAESEAILAELPELSLRSRKGKKFRVWARFALAYETGLRPETFEKIRFSDVTLGGLYIRPEVDKNRWERVIPLTARARAALRSLGTLAPDQPLFGSHDYRTVFRQASLRALGPERGLLPTPYDLKHARVTHWIDEGKPVTGIRFMTGTNVALDHYVQSTRRAAEVTIGGHSGGEPLPELCEGEDLNLHGSYPASTSIEFDSVYIRGKRGKTGTDDDGEPPLQTAAFRESVSLSGGTPRMPDRGVLMPALDALALAAERVLSTRVVSVTSIRHRAGKGVA